MNDIQLTRNFKLSEFIDLKHPPSNEILGNITKLAKRLQQLRDKLGKAIKITSGYRDPEHNKNVGGAPQSYHMKGMAVDCVVQDMEPKDVYKHLTDWQGGIGLYVAHLHLDIRPYRATWKSNLP